MTEETKQRTGRHCYDYVVRVKPDTPDALAQTTALRPRLRRKLGACLADRLADGRTYVFEWQPPELGWDLIGIEHDIVRESVMITLLRPEDAQVGELVHASAFLEKPDLVSVPIGNWQFERDVNGWWMRIK